MGQPRCKRSDIDVYWELIATRTGILIGRFCARKGFHLLRGSFSRLTGYSREWNRDRLLNIGLVAVCSLGCLWVLYIITSAAFFPSNAYSDQAKSRYLERLSSTPRIVKGEIAYFPIIDRNGKQLRVLSDKFGKYILLSWWNADCEVCLSQLRMLDQLQADLGDEQFEVMAVNLDPDGLNDVESIFEQHRIERLEIYHNANSNVAQVLRRTRLPYTVLINRSGFEIGRTIGPVDWNSQELRAILTRISGNS